MVPKLKVPKLLMGELVVLMPPLLSLLPPKLSHDVLFHLTIDVAIGLEMPLLVIELYLKLMRDRSDGVVPVLVTSHLYGVMALIPMGKPVELFAFDLIKDTTQFELFEVLVLNVAFAKSVELSDTGKL